MGLVLRWGCALCKANMAASRVVNFRIRQHVFKIQKVKFSFMYWVLNVMQINLGIVEYAERSFSYTEEICYHLTTL